MMATITPKSPRAEPKISMMRILRQGAWGACGEGARRGGEQGAREARAARDCATACQAAKTHLTNKEASCESAMAHPLPAMPTHTPLAMLVRPTLSPDQNME